MTSFVAEISSQVARGQARIRIPSLVRSKLTWPASPRSRTQSAGSWMRLPGSMGVRLMFFTVITSRRPMPPCNAATAARPWRTTSRPYKRTSSPSIFNAATAVRPWIVLVLPMEYSMDEVVIDVYLRLSHAHNCSVDDVLETPELRNRYLEETRRLLGDLPEREILHRLTNLRKRKKLTPHGAPTEF
jgi:hypothetical protein